MHLGDPEAQVGSSLGEAPNRAGSPDSTFARQEKGLLNSLLVCSTLHLGLGGHGQDGMYLNGSGSRTGATSFYRVAGGGTFPAIFF